MLYNTPHIVFLNESTDDDVLDATNIALPPDWILMNIHNIMGKCVCVVAVKKMVFFSELVYQVCKKLGYEYGAAHLLVDYKKPCSTDTVAFLVPVLEGTNDIVHLLIEENPCQFIWSNCDSWKCMDSSSDPSKHCNYPDHIAYSCCYDVLGEE